MIRVSITILIVLLWLPSWIWAGCRASRIDTLCTTMAEDLAASIQVRMNRGASIMAVSFVDLHNPEQTSSFGRLLSEEIANSFHQFGYRILEPSPRPAAATTRDQNGAFALGRDRVHGDGSVDVQAMLTGSYAMADGGMLVSARIVHAVDKSILAMAQCQLRLTPEVAALINATPPTVHTSALLDPRTKTDAREIQRKLQSLGLYRGKIDGVWGRGSATALRRFKSIRGLPSQPEWDQTTQDALLSTN